MIVSKHRRINSGTTGTPVTTTFYAATVILSQVVLFCSNAGTAWTIKIQDKAGTPAIIVNGTLGVPSDGLPIRLYFEKGLRMEGGVDVVTSGTTAGVVDAWVNAEDGKQ